MNELGDRYVFAHVDATRERQRLYDIESIFDAGSRRVLLLAGAAKGARCLEVGAGGGSIARWLADEVARAGASSPSISTRSGSSRPGGPTWRSSKQTCNRMTCMTASTSSTPATC